MSSITTLSDFRLLLDNGCRSAVFNFGAGNVGVVANSTLSTYNRFQAGPVPTASVACYGNDITALMYVPLSNSKQMWIGDLEFSLGCVTAGTRVSAVLYDRLVHSGGLVGNVTTEQTTNLPTATLPRYTSAVGVIPFLECYTTIGTVTTTATIRYTNQDGTANRVSQAVAIVTNINNSSDCLTAFPLQDGDTGCQSVQGFTMAGASTSAGVMGITLMKRLVGMPPDTGSMVERQAYRSCLLGGGVVEVMAGAYLQMVWTCSTSGTGFYAFMGRIGIAEK